jgi:hypothetical protein
MPTPEPISIATSITALTSIGVLPVITVMAVLGIATALYKRFRS